MRRQVCTEGIRRFQWCQLWCTIVYLSYCSITGHNTLKMTALLASARRAVIVNQKYLQRLGTWRGGHVRPRYRAQGKDASESGVGREPSSRIVEVDWWICGGGLELPLPGVALAPRSALEHAEHAASRNSIKTVQYVGLEFRTLIIIRIGVAERLSKKEVKQIWMHGLTQQLVIDLRLQEYKRQASTPSQSHTKRAYRVSPRCGSGCCVLW